MPGNFPREDNVSPKLEDTSINDLIELFRGIEISSIEKKDAINYIKLLTSKLNQLGNRARRDVDDSTREEILSIYDSLYKVASIKSQDAADFIGQDINTRALSFLENFEFTHFLNFEEFEEYIQQQKKSGEKWSSIKLSTFLIQINKYLENKNADEKKNILSQLFDIESVRGVEWNDVMLSTLAGIVKGMKGQPKTRLKVLFNNLPKIKNRGDRGESRSGPWNTLFYDDSMIQRGSGTQSSLRTVPARMGAVAARR